MLNKQTSRLIFSLTSLVLAAGVFAGCRSTRFSGDGKVTKAPPLCSEVKAIDGINLAFLIDNSSSNNITDCPNRAYVSRNSIDPNVSEYECRGATNREKAVLSSFDFINSFEPKDGKSISQIGITSFPASDDLFDGYEIRSKDWLKVEKDTRAEVESSMAFSRRPLGSTPYHAALESGIKLYKDMNDHGKPKLALLVTDGEPTDEDAGAARKSAEALRKLGAKIITIFVTGEDTRDQRRERHLTYLRGLIANGAQTEANIAELMGLNGKKSLVDSISDQKIEVTNSSELEGVFRDVIKKAVNCREE